MQLLREDMRCRRRSVPLLEVRCKREVNIIGISEHRGGGAEGVEGNCCALLEICTVGQLACLQGEQVVASAAAASLLCVFRAFGCVE